MKLSKLSKKQLIKKLKASEKSSNRGYTYLSNIIKSLRNELSNIRDYSALQSKEFDIVSSALQSCENANVYKEKEIEHKDRLLESIIKS